MELFSFKFKGRDSREFGILAMNQLPFIAERQLTAVEIPGRMSLLTKLQPMRKNGTLSLTLRTLDSHKSANEINAWLQGSGDLVLSTEPDKKYRAFVNSAIKPYRMSGKFGSFPVVFTVEPFRYAVFNPMNDYPVSLDDDNTARELNIYCRGTADCEPLFFIKLAGKLTITVNDAPVPLTVETPGNYTASGVNSARYEYEQLDIYIDCAGKLVYARDMLGDKYVITDRTTGIFPVLRHEDNFIRLELTGRYLSEGKYLSEFKCRNNERWH